MSIDCKKRTRCAGLLCLLWMTLIAIGIPFGSVLVVADDTDMAERSELLRPDHAKRIKFFRDQIEPLLERHCYSCHSHESGTAKGGLVLDSRAGWENGGSQGPAIVPGQPEESLLIQAVRYESLEMPPDDRLTAQQIDLLEQWIRDGAHDPRKQPHVEIGQAKLWALQPLERPEIPNVTNASWPRDAIDAFILAKLDSHDLVPAGDADRYVLLRRVTLDLTGLPPTPEEITAFVGDKSESAYEKVVDRLLDSPSFGDHWARHWFDLACYADLADVSGNVLIRDAWRYRDYVINALNEDKPFDQFIREQIAGDLLPAETVEQRREQIVATGYLAIGPWTLQNYIKKQLDADVVDHQIDRIGRTFLGQTLSCARCHDHKFDPVPTRDYYALAGIFHSTRTTQFSGPGVWSAINEVELPRCETLKHQAYRREQLARWRKKKETLTTELAVLRSQIPGSTDGNELASEQEIPTTKLAAANPVSDEQKRARSRAIEIERQLKEVIAKIAEVERGDTPEKALAVQDVDRPHDVPIYRRGDFRSTGEIVPRGFLNVLPHSAEYVIPPETSGRLQLADWLTDHRNPLTARVLVNRIWHHLFGNGLVRSVDYFGAQGEKPSHPELLDFLAIRFRDGDDWSLKQTVRHMVLSRTYRMASSFNARGIRLDPNNQWFWHMPRRRMSAEAIRDAMLAASGQLDRNRGGPSLGLELEGNVRGLGGNVNPPTWAGTIPKYVRNRRAVYQPLKRDRPNGELEILSVFDFPHPSDITGRRSQTNVATQALFLLNSPFVKRQAAALATRLESEFPNDEEARLSRLFLVALNRPAASGETKMMRDFLDQCAEQLNGDRAAAWTQLCHATLGSNSFLFYE